MREELEKKEKRDNEAGESAVAVCCSSESVVEREGEFLPLRSSRSPLLSSPLFCQIKEAGTCGEPAAHRHLPQAATPPPLPPSQRTKTRHNSTAPQLCVPQTRQPTTEGSTDRAQRLCSPLCLFIWQTLWLGGGVLGAWERWFPLVQR